MTDPVFSISIEGKTFVREGPRANAILCEVVRVWDLVRRELVKLQAPAPPALPPARDPRIDELLRNPEFMHPRAELRHNPREEERVRAMLQCARAARAGGDLPCRARRNPAHPIRC